MAVDGVVSAEANYGDGIVRLEVGTGVTDRALSEAVSGAGYVLDTDSRPPGEVTAPTDAPPSREAPQTRPHGASSGHRSWRPKPVR